MAILGEVWYYVTPGGQEELEQGGEGVRQAPAGFHPYEGRRPDVQPFRNTAIAGPLGEALEAEMTPAEHFKVFFPEDIYEKIVENK